MVAVGPDEMVLADIPGLIEGAHEGVGLGTRFLGHVERCRVLIHLIDGTLADVAAAYRTVRDEIAAYGAGLLDKPEIVVLNKIDAIATAELEGKRTDLSAAAGREALAASGATGAGVPQVIAAAMQEVRAARATSAVSRKRLMMHRLRSAGLTLGKVLVIKIGSALLTEETTGAIRRDWLEALAEDIAACRRHGQKVILVSSGAIAVGRRLLQFNDGALRLHEKQAAAATGMIRLAHAYQEVLAKYQITVAQVLLTLDDSEDRRRYINARNTLTTLLRVDAVPLINENDTVATDEIRFGDNDRLAARVAAMISADTLVLLSDIDGLYTADPHGNADARFIEEVREITPEIEAMAGEPRSAIGSGGMVTKLTAGRIALTAGCRMVIAHGHDLHPLRRIQAGARCTWFLPAATRRRRASNGSPGH